MPPFFVPRNTCRMNNCLAFGVFAILVAMLFHGSVLRGVPPFLEGWQTRQTPEQNGLPKILKGGFPLRSGEGRPLNGQKCTVSDGMSDGTTCDRFPEQVIFQPDQKNPAWFMRFRWTQPTTRYV
jgi:hypothetical protein